MKSGFTLPEVALALVIASLLLGIALPRFTALKQEVVIEQAAQALVAAHRRARTLAVASGHPAILSVADRSLRITLGGAAQPHWLGPRSRRTGHLGNGYAPRPHLLPPRHHHRAQQRHLQPEPRLGHTYGGHLAARPHPDPAGALKTRGRAQPLVEVVLAHLVQQGGAGDAQQLRGTPAVPAGVAQRERDVPTLGGIEAVRLTERRRARAPREAAPAPARAIRGRAPVRRTRRSRSPRAAAGASGTDTTWWPATRNAVTSASRRSAPRKAPVRGAEAMETR